MFIFIFIQFIKLKKDLLVVLTVKKKKQAYKFCNVILKFALEEQLM